MTTVNVETGSAYTVNVDGAQGLQVVTVDGDAFGVNVDAPTENETNVEPAPEYSVWQPAEVLGYDATVQQQPNYVSVPHGIQIVNITGGAAAEVLPNRTLRGTGGNVQYIYVGFSSAAIGSENEAAPEWKVYRYDTVLDTSSFADGDQVFDNIWDDRESLTYP